MTQHKRIGWLDLWRTIAIALMLAYHFIFDLVSFGRIPVPVMELPVMTAVRMFTCSSFIFLAGVSACFSRNCLRRGAIAFCAGLLVTAASLLVDFPVYFGILQLLGLCIVLYGVCGKYLSRLPTAWTAAGALALFLVSFPCASGVEVEVPWLWMFGFVRPEFFSGDYYPLFPWMFVFILGTCLGRRLAVISEDSHLYRPFPRFLTWPGKHSLIIYLLHQPVIYGLCLLFLR